MAGIMGKDAYVKVCKKAELLEKENEFLNARIKTLIKEIEANGETIKAKDAKIDELVIQAAYNELKKSSYAGQLSSLFKENEGLKERNEKLKEVNLHLQDENGRLRSRDLLSSCSTDFLKSRVETYKKEVSNLNAACQAKNRQIDNYEKREKELSSVIYELEMRFGIVIEEFNDYFIVSWPYHPGRMQTSFAVQKNNKELYKEWNLPWEDDHE